MSSRSGVAPSVRIGILTVFSVGIFLLAYYITGSFIPKDPGEQVVFLNGLLLVVLSSELVEHQFTKPADAAVNAFLSIVLLMGFYQNSFTVVTYSLIGYSAITLLLSFTCIAVSHSEHIRGLRKRVADWTYRPSTLLGRATHIYSVIFFYSMLRLYGVESSETGLLTAFWGLFIFFESMDLPKLLTQILDSSYYIEDVAGKVVQTEAPDLVRVSLHPNEEWSRESLKLYHRVDGKQIWILPLYSQVQEEKRIGTGLLIGENDDEEYSAKHISGSVTSVDIEDSERESLIREKLGGDEDSQLSGFIIENSSISEIKFEIWNPHICEEGMLVWCEVGGKQVFYQITSGINTEEHLEDGRYGYQIGTAVQLGWINDDVGEESSLTKDGVFNRYGWLPQMNTPVFAVGQTFGEDFDLIDEPSFKYGNIPRTSLDVSGDIVGNLDHHTAILGVTGSGKTELTLDIIRHVQDNGVKVFCIDLTGQYISKLGSTNISDISISGDPAQELTERLFDVETGEYSASEEKQALREYSEELRENIENETSRFIEDDDVNTALIELQEISNTKATLRLTEMYLTSILHYARDQDDYPPMLIVVEEAHTVIPETNTVGIGDWDSKALVNKISQVALQGRKYDIGLLVVTQRTANVSKSVLTQCNTIVSFACHDSTSLRFLENSFGEEYTAMVPNLEPLQAIVAGKGLSSSHPLKVDIPFEPEKYEE